MVKTAESSWSIFLANKTFKGWRGPSVDFLQALVENDLATKQDIIIDIKDLCKEIQQNIDHLRKETQLGQSQIIVEGTVIAGLVKLLWILENQFFTSDLCPHFFKNTYRKISFVSWPVET